MRAKYERQEFLVPEKQEPYSAGELGALPHPLRTVLLSLENWPVV